MNQRLRSACVTGNYLFSPTGNSVGGHSGLDARGPPRCGHRLLRGRPRPRARAPPPRRPRPPPPPRRRLPAPRRRPPRGRPSVRLGAGGGRRRSRPPAPRGSGPRSAGARGCGIAGDLDEDDLRLTRELGFGLALGPTGSAQVGPSPRGASPPGGRRRLGLLRDGAGDRPRVRRGGALGVGGDTAPRTTPEDVADDHSTCRDGGAPGPGPRRRRGAAPRPCTRCCRTPPPPDVRRGQAMSEGQRSGAEVPARRA
jgi:hypothetical protein